MTDKVEVKNVHREPHPFVGLAHIPNFTGKTIAFVGKVDRIEETTMYMKTANETEVKIIRFKGDAEKFPVSAVIEIRGIVNKDGSISYGECSQYDNEFDLGAFESMLDYYHGMCRSLSVK